MDRAVEIATYVNDALFVALAIVGIYQWIKQRSEATRWFAATFVILAVIVVAVLVQPEASDSTAFEWLVKLEIAALVLFPYFLYRFMASFVRPAAWINTLATVLTAGVIVWTLLLPNIPSENEARSAVFSSWLVAFAVQWSLLSLMVTVRLWSAGRGQPSVARARMRLLSVGAFALTAVLILSATAEPQDESSSVALIRSGITFLSVLSFLVGFAPPGWMRVVWRRPEADALQGAVAGLMASRTPQDVAGKMLPHVVQIIGARGAAVLDSDGNVIAAHGTSPQMMQQLSDAAPESLRTATQTSRLLVLPYEFGSLVVWASPYTPFFGREEVGLVTSLGALTDIAMERAALSIEREQSERAMADAFSRERLSRVGLERANQELEAFVYAVSHDLNSPLISVLGYIELLDSEHASGLAEEARFYLERIKASTSYMQSLIKDLLELSRVGRVQTEPDDVDLDALVNDVTYEIRAHHPEVAVDVTGDLPDVRMNPVRARQLFANVINNSVKYAQRPDVRVEVSAAEEQNGLVTLSIADNGPGIDEKDRDRVFGVFERLGAQQEGTGMGLAVCKRIVETSGGRIWIADSASGTDMRIALPCADETNGLGGDR